MKRRLAHVLKRTARLLIKAANRLDPPRIGDHIAMVEAGRAAAQRFIAHATLEKHRRGIHYRGQIAGMAAAGTAEVFGVSGQMADDLTPGWAEKLAGGLAGEYGGH